MSGLNFGQSNITLPTSNAGGQSQREPALGFINVFIPRNDGSKCKLGYFALKASKKDEKELFDILSGGDISAADLAQFVEFDFRPNDGGNSSGLAIKKAS